MIRLIMKNLWSRRRRNGWLLAELILVCIVTWIVTDPIIVLTHDRNLPEGFRPDHLFVLNLRNYPSDSDQYRKEENDTLARKSNFERLLMKLKSYEGVESATYILDGMMPYGKASSTTSMPFDTVWINAFQISFVSRSDYFRTMGIEGAEGMTGESLDQCDFADGEMVVSADILSQLPDKKPLYNRQIMNYDSTATHRVAGVMNPIRLRSHIQAMPLILHAEVALSYYYYNRPQIAFRIRDNISEEAFLHRFRPWMNKELVAGNFYAQGVTSYLNIKKDNEFSSGVTNEYRINIALGLFFLVNLCLGVAGTFWMQTRTRREEVGIILSFGGSPGGITRMLLAEGWVLTTLATFIGCAVYLQYTLKNGLYSTLWDGFGVAQEYWVNHFGLHFLIVSLIVYLILMLVVSLGIWIPAYRISHIHPVEALREE